MENIHSFQVIYCRKGNSNRLHWGQWKATSVAVPKVIGYGRTLLEAINSASSRLKRHELINKRRE